MACTRWEYQTLTVLAPWDASLNDAGAAGWELVALGRAGEYTWWVVFKRPKH